MPTVVNPVVIDDFTSGSLEGTGVFDKMMQTVKEHVAQEYSAGRIKGTEYSTVYLGALQSTMDRALEFLLQKDKAAMEAALIQAQITKVDAEVIKVNAEVLLVQAQTALTDQQLLNAQAEKLRIEAQTAQIAIQNLKIQAETALAQQELINATAEKLRIDAQTSLLIQQEANAVIEGTVLVAQECKLRAEFDVLMETKLKVIAETGLLAQKKITEQAQTSAAGVDADSVIGKQKTLYERQADGFTRNAEHAVAKLMVDTWNVRRTTDEGTVASATNKLDDVYIGQAVTKLLAGVGA